MRASFSMRSSRLSMTGDRRIVAGSCITAIEAAKADSTGRRNTSAKRRLR
jgi:hypothetical protein